ncbi:MAG: sigma factor-like helix-turn-helix DNA-binding protein [Ruminococcus sp.]
MAKDLKLVLLLDCYGTLLTDRQRQMIQLYYDEDLSLGEIAQIIGISRQAVRTVSSAANRFYMTWKRICMLQHA